MELDNIIKGQKKYFRKKIIFSKIKDRIQKIKDIRNWIKVHEQSIIDTILKDYQKPVAEIYATEINPVLNHINFTLKNIKNWTSSRSVWSPIQLIGSKSKLYYEPKGVCLIVSPWNYPFNLTLNPIISAISAGNCMVVKPSEFTPNTSSLMRDLIGSIFHPDEILVLEGDHEIGAQLITLNFDHIFFTGSPEIGKIVMDAAAKNLTSITLELGGKNHAIVDETANLKDAAEKILWSKYVNAGQTCIAVNHVFVHESCYESFVSYSKNVLSNFFSNNPDYGEIVNKKHFNRLEKILHECLVHSGTCWVQSSNLFKNTNHFPLTIIRDVSIKNPILGKEIFGPILPIIKYKDFDSVLNYINCHDKSLALYLFTKSNKNTDSFLQITSSGTVAINECMLQYANPYLPFGGVNTSGIGKTGGKSGFLEFSNQKSVLFQKSGFSVAKFIYPPYTSIKKKLAKVLG